MDRQEALDQLADAIIAAGPIEKMNVIGEGKICLFVLEHPGTMDDHCAHGLREGFERALQGTPLEGVRCVVLEEGITLRAVAAEAVLG